MIPTMILFSLRRGFLNTTSSPLSLRSVSRFSSDLHRRRDYMPNSDCRPIALRDRVDLLIRLSDLDAAAKHARLAPFSIERTKRYGLFDKDLKNEEAVDWTCGAIVVAMCKAERYRDALDLISYFFVEHKMIPARYSFNRVLKALFDDSSKLQARTTLLGVKRLAQEGAFDEAMDPFYTRPRPTYLYKSMCFWTFGKSFDVSNRLIRVSLDLGDFEEARKLFEELKLRDGYDNFGNTAKFMEYWLKQGKEEEAMECFRRAIETFYKAFSKYSYIGFGELLEWDLTGTHSLIQVLFKYDKKTEAWELFNHLLSKGIVFFQFDTDTLNLMVNEHFTMGRFYDAIDTFNMIRIYSWSVGPYKLEKLYKNIIARFCEVGLLYEAERFFQEMRVRHTIKPNASTYCTMMDAYVKAGRVEDVVRISNQMVDDFLGHVADELIGKKNLIR